MPAFGLADAPGALFNPPFTAKAHGDPNDDLEFRQLEKQISILLDRRGIHDPHFPPVCPCRTGDRQDYQVEGGGPFIQTAGAKTDQCNARNEGPAS